MSVKKDYAAIAEALGMRYDETDRVMYGQKGGFEVVIFAENSNYPYWFTIQTTATRPDRGMLDKNECSALSNSAKPLGVCKQNGNQITAAVVNRSKKQQKLIGNMTEAVNGFVTYLQGAGFAACCSVCGQQEPTSLYKSGGSFTHLCVNCESRVSGSFAERERENTEKRENVIGGVVGALLGSLIGVAVIVILGQMGYVAAISGVVMAVCVLKGYELLGGKLTKKGIVISVVLILVMTYIGSQVDWAISVYNEGGGKDVGFSLFECYRMIPDLLETEFIDRTVYATNLAMLYLFVLVGMVPTIYGTLKQKKEAGTMRKIGSAGSYSSME